MNEQDLSMEEFSVREGEGTPFAATLTCTPDEDCEGNLEWIGRIHFDNDFYNWPHEIPNFDTGKLYIIYDDWKFPYPKTGGTYLMNLLVDWHQQIVALIGRVREVQP